MKINIFWGKNIDPFICDDFYNMKERLEELYQNGIKEFNIKVVDSVSDLIIKEKGGEK